MLSTILIPNQDVLEAFFMGSVDFSKLTLIEISGLALSPRFYTIGNYICTDSILSLGSKYPDKITGPTLLVGALFDIWRFQNFGVFDHFYNMIRNWKLYLRKDFNAVDGKYRLFDTKNLLDYSVRQQRNIICDCYQLRLGVAPGDSKFLLDSPYLWEDSVGKKRMIARYEELRQQLAFCKNSQNSQIQFCIV